jgi:hypothetical protein
MAGLLRNVTYREELPAVFFHPKQWNKQTVVWIDEAGKGGLFAENSSSRPKPEIQKLLDAGATVVGVDLLYQGEFLADGKPITQTRRVKNTREAAAYTFGYNHSLFAQRVHDILTVVKFIKDSERKTETLDVVGLRGAGPWVAAARAQAGDAIDRAVVDTGGFRFGKVIEIHDVNFLPGGAKYGDLPGFIALSAPGKLWLGGEGARPLTVVRAMYPASAENLTCFAGDREPTHGDAVNWLLTKARN